MRILKFSALILTVTVLLASCARGGLPSVADGSEDFPFSQDMPEFTEPVSQTDSGSDITTDSEVTIAEMSEETEPTSATTVSTSEATTTEATTTVTTTVTTTATTTKAATSATTATTVPATASTQPTGYPELEPLDVTVEKAIINDYAKFAGVGPRSVVLGGYYGTYDAGEVVLVHLNISTYDEGVYFVMGENEFDIKGTQMIYLHSGGAFIEIYKAYNDGLLSDDDAAAIYHYFTEMGVTEPELPTGLPELEPLSKAAEEKLIEDYLKTIDERYIDEVMEYGGGYVAKYYGTYGGNEVVLMKNYALQETDAISYLNVAGYEFRFSTGNTSISLHYKGGFILLADAYELGLLSRSEIAEIAYYAKH